MKPIKFYNGDTITVVDDNGFYAMPHVVCVAPPDIDDAEFLNLLQTRQNEEEV